MITVTVNAIMFDTEYEFRLDPDALVSELTEEIAEVICQKEQCHLNGNSEELIFFSKERNCIIASNATLNDFGIKTGDTLYFG